MSEKEVKDPILALTEKLDAALERLEKLENPPEPEIKEDAKPPVDPRIPKAENLIRGILKDNLPKEKLDSMGLDELMLAHDLRSTMKVERVKPNAPGFGISTPKNDADVGLTEEEIKFKYAIKNEVDA